MTFGPLLCRNIAIRLLKSPHSPGETESDIPPEPTRQRRSDVAIALKGGVAVSRREIGAKRKPLNALGSAVAMLFTGSGRFSFFPFLNSILFLVVAGAGGVVGQRASVVHNPPCANYRFLNYILI